MPRAQPKGCGSLQSGALHSSLSTVPEGGAHDLDWRRNTRPQLEGGGSLREEDLETVDDSCAGSLSCSGGRGSRVREVDENLPGAKLGQHLFALRGRVDHEIYLRDVRRPGAPA